MTNRSWIRDRFARTRRRAPKGPRKTPSWGQRSLEALEGRALLSVNLDPSPIVFHPTLVNVNTTFAPQTSGSVTPDTSGQPPSGALTPAQVRHIYGFDQISNLGAGQTIGIVAAFDDPNIMADLDTFDQQFGLTSSGASLYAQFGAASSFLTVRNQYGQGKPLPVTDRSGGWELEESLDVEWAHAIAPQAKIILVEASQDTGDNLFTAVDVAVKLGATVVSNSWGVDESTVIQLEDFHFKAKNVTYVFAAGDQGTPSYPATSPYVVSVGGTTLSHDANFNWTGESAWSSGGGGVSKLESKPAYQAGLNYGRRATPDVAYDADPNSGFAVYDSFGGDFSPAGWATVGGTNAGAPQWAALFALANQGRAAEGKGALDGASQALPALYSMTSDSSGTQLFDVVTGGRATAKAGPGFDLLTGNGTPRKASNVVSYLVNLPSTVAQKAVTVNEGSPATNSGTFDPTLTPGAVTLSASLGVVTWNSTNGTWNWNDTPPDGPYHTTVTITATYTGGATVKTGFTLNVLNVAPTITSVKIPTAGAEGFPVNLSATATDPGVLDTLTYTWSVTRPDGSAFATLTGPQSSFTPPDNGNYGVSLTVTDKDGGTTITTSTAGLDAWWRGELNANDVLGVDNGTLGSVTFAAGEVGEAFNLNGSDQVTVSNAPNLNLTAAVTLEAWIKPSTLAFNNNYGAIIAKSSGTARDYGLFVKSNGALQLSYINASGTNVFLQTAANLVPVGQFSHVAAVIDTTAGVMQLYINGQLVASRATSGPMVANGVPLTIGLSDPGLNYGFKGLIDEPSVYGRALSPGEIQAIVSAGSKGKIPPVAVANNPPTPALRWSGTVVATVLHNFTAAATDPSPVDQAAGFAYSINWGDGSPIQSIGATAGNGNGVTVSHAFPAAGTYSVTVLATDKDHGTRGLISTVTVTGLGLPDAILSKGAHPKGSFTFLNTTDVQGQSVVSGVDGLSAQATPPPNTRKPAVSSYNAVTASPPAGVTLRSVGQELPDKPIVPIINGSSPALLTHDIVIGRRGERVDLL